MAEPTIIVKGTAPIHRYDLTQNGAVMSLSGAGVAATLKMERVDAPTTVYTFTATGLNASGWMYVTYTTTSSATACEFAGDIIVSGLASGSWGPEEPLRIIVRDDKGA